MRGQQGNKPDRNVNFIGYQGTRVRGMYAAMAGILDGKLDQSEVGSPGCAPWAPSIRFGIWNYRKMAREFQKARAWRLHLFLIRLR